MRESFAFQIFYLLRTVLILIIICLKKLMQNKYFTMGWLTQVHSIIAKKL